MKTKIYKIDSIENCIDLIHKAATVINTGGLVAFPTETVYGLGGDGLNPAASKKIYTAKGRPQDNPLILHIANTNQLNTLVKEVTPSAKKLIAEFWPGPLTLVFKKSDLVPYESSGGLDTIAIRYPKNKIAQKLIELSNTPIAAPSANKSGRPSPTRASHVLYDLNGAIDVIIDGGRCEFGLESTIVDVSTNEPCLLRPGSITLGMLKEVIGDITIDKSILKKLDKNELPKAPGMKYTHYSPNARVIIVNGSEENIITKINELIQNTDKSLKTGVIAYEETKDKYTADEVLVIGSKKQPTTIAANLFKVLRRCDYLNINIVFVESFSEQELGLAIMNRLNKAAGYSIIDV